MRQSHQLALAGVTLLALGLFIGVSSDQTSADPPANLEATRRTSAVDSTTTTFFDVLDAAAPGLADLEDAESQLTEEAAARATSTTSSSTTTTAPSPTTTSPPPKATPTTKAPAATTTTSQAITTTSAPSGGPVAGAESDFAGRINSLRSSNGLGGLSRNGSLDARARDWSRSMAESGSLRHSNLGSLLGPWSAVAENVGAGPSVSKIFSGLSNSSGHRNNMLGDYTHMGVGVWEDSNGNLWTTHVFAR